MPISMLSPYSEEKFRAIILSLTNNYPNCKIIIIPTGPLYRFNYLLKYVFTHKENNEALEKAILDGKNTDESWHNNLTIKQQSLLRECRCEIFSWHQWIGEDLTEIENHYEQLKPHFNQDSESYLSAETALSNRNLLNKYQKQYVILKHIIDQQASELTESIKNYLVYKKIIESEFNNEISFKTDVMTSALSFLTNLIKNTEYNFFTEQQITKLLENGNLDIAKEICNVMYKF